VDCWDNAEMILSVLYKRAQQLVLEQNRLKHRT